MKYMIICWLACLITLGVVAHKTQEEIAAQIKRDSRKQRDIGRRSCETHFVRKDMGSVSVEDRSGERCLDER